MTAESQQQVTNSTDEISLKELILKIRQWWLYILSKWIVISVFGLLGGVIGIGYSYLKKTTYNATTTFVLEDEKGTGGLGNLVGLASMAGVDLGSSGGGIFQADNILSLYNSRTMIEKTLLTSVEADGRKQLLVERYIDFNELRDKWSKNRELVDFKFSMNGSENSKPDRLRDSILAIMVSDISKNYLFVTKPDKKISTIQVDVKAKDETFAKDFNDELVKNVSEFYIQTKTKKTIQNVNILQHKTDSVKAVMNGAIYTAVEVADATPNLNLTRQVQRLAPAQKAQFSAETNKGVLGELVKNLELAKITLLKETPLVQIIDKPILPLENDRIGKIKGFIFGAGLSVILGVFFLLVRKMLKQILN